MEPGREAALTHRTRQAVPDAAGTERSAVHPSVGLYAGVGQSGLLTNELRDEIRNLLARSFPNPGDDVKIIEMFAASAEDDRLGIPIQKIGDKINYAYRVAILSASVHANPAKAG